MAGAPEAGAGSSADACLYRTLESLVDMQEKQPDKVGELICQVLVQVRED